MIAINAPEVQAIAVNECGEGLRLLLDTVRLRVDVSGENAKVIGYQPDFRVRADVERRLRAAAGALPPGVCLQVKEGFRPLHIQAEIFRRYLNRLQERHPSCSHEWLYAEASKYIAPPEAATHVTGGAVDVTLIDEKGAAFDLGTDYDASPETCGYKCYSRAPDISPEAKRHREILFGVMSSAGFVNYPYEWWHWSYGDRYWAHLSNKTAAIYGPV